MTRTPRGCLLRVAGGRRLDVVDSGGRITGNEARDGVQATSEAMWLLRPIIVMPTNVSGGCRKAGGIQGRVPIDELLFDKRMRLKKLSFRMNEVTTVVASRLSANCYIMSDGDFIGVVDPCDSLQRIAKEIGARSDRPRLSIMLTHGHVDHIASVPKLVRLYPETAVYAGRAENLLLFDSGANLSRHVGEPVTFADISGAVRNVSTADELHIGNITVKVIETPGHTPGSVTYVVDAWGVAFCGDTILKGTVGGTNLPFGDESRLLASIRDRILTLPDAFKLLPAHGQATDVRHEKETNPYVCAMNVADR
jgi:glyoxylase-like metal-dependent hydrolase (beta-lactamase superfamily II)